MADALLECIPNISEGQRPEVIQAVAQAIEAVPEVYLLEVDPGYSANRTVFTFVGPPDAVVEGAFQCIRLAAQWIDMRVQQGIHPRMGATDVCPLVPLSGLSLADADRYARQLAARVGSELNIPVYLYEHSATASHRQNLAHIRSGEYEGFVDKIQQAEWLPDFGPKTFQAKPGQTVIGAREFLLAYNLNLNTDKIAVAKEIARDIRESGRVVTVDGQRIRKPGRCKGLKAIGWYVEEYGFAQVSTNITRLSESPLHTVYEAASQAAENYGVQVTGSELIGMIPEAALLAAGSYFSQGEIRSQEAQLNDAVKHLGLAQLAPFSLTEKILERRLKHVRGF